MGSTLAPTPAPDRKHAVSLMRLRQAQCRFIISAPGKLSGGPSPAWARSVATSKFRHCKAERAGATGRARLTVITGTQIRQARELLGWEPFNLGAGRRQVVAREVAVITTLRWSGSSGSALRGRPVRCAARERAT
jgi:hypothetical protein